MASIEVHVSPAVEAYLYQQATASGLTADAYASNLLEGAASLSALNEASAPVRRQVVESGMSDEEFCRFIDEIREEIYEERSRFPEVSIADPPTFIRSIRGNK